MRPRATALAAALVLCASCASKEPPTLQGAMDSVLGEVQKLLGAPTLPGAHLAELSACHVEKGWAFDPAVADAFERTRDAARGLGNADYGTWREAALVLQVLTTMVEEHPSALVRAECVDSLSRIGSWTIAAVPPAERRTTEPEVLKALQRIRELAGTKSEDPVVAGEVADAVNVLAAFRFDAARQLPEKADLRTAAATFRSQLNTSRGVLRALTGASVGVFEADPRVRDALDRGYVSVGASAVRASVLFCAVGDPEEIVRNAAARDLALVRPDHGPAALGLLAAGDTATSVRREAARALAAFPAESAVPALLPALSDDMGEVRAAAASSLALVTGQAFGDDRTAWLRWWQARSGGATPAPAPSPDPVR